MTEVIPSTIPRMLHKGKYALWEKPDGTLRIQFKRDDMENEEFFEIPGFVLALGKAASEGKLSPIQMFSEMQKHMRGKR